MNVEWVPDTAWIMGEGGRCRAGATKGVKACGRPSVASLRRGKQWWDYCEDHMYGRRIIDIDATPTVCIARFVPDPSRPVEDQKPHPPRAFGESTPK